MTRRRLIITLAICLSLLGAVVVALLDKTNQPHFQGRKLSDWVNDLRAFPLTQRGTFVARPRVALRPGLQRVIVRNPSGTQTVAFRTPTGIVSSAVFTTPPFIMGQPSPDEIARHYAATQAVRAIGTNAIPHLLATIYSHDGKFRTLCMKWLGKQTLIKFSLRTAEEKQSQALSAMGLLGPEALWAWVEVVTNDLASPDVQVYAARQLSVLGREAMPALSAMLLMQNHPEPRAWSSISWAIQQCDRLGILPSIRNLNSTNREIRASAAWSLGFIGQHPDMIVPALERALKDDAPQVRREAVLALGKFGTNAVPAKNAIERMTNDPDVMVRNAATNALQQVTGSEAID